MGPSEPVSDTQTTTQTTTQATPLAVNVAGFLRGGLGLGEAARLYVAALQAAGVPVRTTTIDVRLPDIAGAKQKVVEFTEMGADLETAFNLVCVNAPELPAFAADVGHEFFEGRRTIGVWAWEVDRIPADWAPAFPLVDEIWVYSQYVAEILSRAAMVPVVRVPLAVIRPVVPEGTVLDLGLPDRFTFLFLFDFYSTLVRKNPLGLIDAFKRAFEPGEGPQLVLKSHNGDYKPERLASVLAAIGDRPDILLVDRFLTPAEKNALMDRSDCYVSLHRAEGFGLTLAEAMALGKPVIATGYSANTDFMTPANSYLVEHGYTEVGPEGENYPADGTLGRARPRPRRRADARGLRGPGEGARPRRAGAGRHRGELLGRGGRADRPPAPGAPRAVDVATHPRPGRRDGDGIAQRRCARVDDSTGVGRAQAHLRSRARRGRGPRAQGACAPVAAARDAPVHPPPERAQHRHGARAARDLRSPRPGLDGGPDTLQRARAAPHRAPEHPRRVRQPAHGGGPGRRGARRPHAPDRRRPRAAGLDAP